MKIRNGFVSNSSSSCFICDVDMTPKEAKELLKIILDCYNTMMEEEEKYEDVFGTVCIGTKKDKKDLNTTIYKDRFDKLCSIVAENGNVRIIPTTVVKDLQEALKITSDYMTNGYEGAILKDMQAVFKDGTSKHQLKLKLQIDCEMRITGFTEGSGKNLEYFGAITFENDEGTIKGKVGVSSMTEELRDWFHARRDEVIGHIMSVQFNDLSKAEGNDHHALSHPRFIELREDKDSTDTLETVLKLRDMAMDLN